MTARSPARRLRHGLLVVIAPIVLAVVATACTKSSPTAPDEQPVGQRQAVAAGCAGCHGATFRGGVGPSWHGLAGSTVDLTNGSTVIADRAYLVESIKDPAAEKVAGYNVEMPSNSLSAAEVETIVDYIETLGR